MRVEDLSEDRKANLVPVGDNPALHAIVAPPTPRELIPGPKARAEASQAYEALGALQGVMRHIPNAKCVMRVLRLREAVSSSRIEGTKTHLKDLLIYQATRSNTDLPQDVQVTQRLETALKLGLARIQAKGRKALKPPLLNFLHGVLMQDAPESEEAGVYRHHQVWIGHRGSIEHATFIPAPPDKLQDCMEDLSATILQYTPGEDETRTCILDQLAIAHAQFETIHPYLDGNGRIGRLLLPLMMQAEGYLPLYVSGSLLKARREYYRALADIQLRGNWAPWQELLLFVTTQTARETLDLAEKLLEITQEWDKQLESYRADSATRGLPPFLIGHPVLSVQQAAIGIGVSVPAANAALNTLAEKGIVSLVTETARNRVFQASEVLKRLDKLDELY